MVTISFFFLMCWNDSIEVSSRNDGISYFPAT